MKLSESIKPISYLKAHASELVRDVHANRKTLVITQNGEAKVVVQDLRSYEEGQESMNLLKILAQSTASKSKGNYKNVTDSFKSLRSRIDEAT
ncbi:MAG: type II toxin-antitoxin system Phd/YefM family antitoxin [Kiritimatiellae bacterium]|jgi:prevent-host-death family protein|nr:type II toxin-antitoxin system Phd/YefM family antitoxin [Kiritimatiellia bacterium]